jgi:GNAT superfamily N-acetyltransferase
MANSAILSQIKELYPDVRIYISEEPHQIYIHTIQVPEEKRGKGIGREIIELVKNYARGQNKPVVLEPSPERGYTKKLEKFYKSLKFVKNQGRNKDFTLSKPFAKTMYWKPDLDFTEWLSQSENKNL